MVRGQAAGARRCVAATTINVVVLVVLIAGRRRGGGPHLHRPSRTRARRYLWQGPSWAALYCSCGGDGHRWCGHGNSRRLGRALAGPGTVGCARRQVLAPLLGLAVKHSILSVRRPPSVGPYMRARVCVCVALGTRAPRVLTSRA
jgi:hypothetical protein